MDLIFNPSTPNTIGVEIELQIIDPETKELASGSPQIIQKANQYKNIKKELYQSVVEINTDICANIDDVREQLTRIIGSLQIYASESGYQLAGAGTHPFSHWATQEIYPDPRYYKFLDNIQYLVRRMLTFGLHVHVGVDNAEKAIYINNSLISYLPLIFALSTSGPFWSGLDTGLESIRPKIFETLPNAGMPTYLHCWHEFKRTISLLEKAGSIQSAREIWWDVRPHPVYGTIEIRACDTLPTLNETIAVVALVQTLVAWLSDKYDNNDELILLPYMIAKENRWRSIRYGLDAEIIDLNGNVTGVKDLLKDLLDTLAEKSSSLNNSHELIKVLDIMKNGTSSTRQRNVYKKTKSLPAVVESLVEEFNSNNLCLV